MPLDLTHLLVIAAAVLIAIPKTRDHGISLIQSLIAHAVSLTQSVAGHFGSVTGSTPPVTPMLRSPAKSTGDPSEPK